MNNYENAKVDMSGLKAENIKSLWQTFYDILYERGELGNCQITVKNVERR